MRRLLGALVLLGAVSSLQAARLPDWARLVAEQAPPVEAASAEGFESRVLLSDTTITVLPDGSFRTRRLLARQSLHPGAEDVGISGHGFGLNSRVKTAKAWHLPPGEKVEKSQTPPVELGDPTVYATDRKARMVRVEGIRRGSLVFFEFEAEERAYTLGTAYAFDEGAPIREARFRLELPPGWGEKHAWVRGAGPEPETSGSSVTWTLHDLTPPPEESLAPPPDEVAPMLAVVLVPPPGERLAAETVTDWKAMGLWLEELHHGREEPTAAVQAAARDALKGAGDDPYATILGAARYVRDKVRYIDREVGIGGYQPRPAQQVATELIGDCKDKATLYRALLAAAGRRAYPVIVNLTEDATVSDTVPTLRAFNHVVAAVELPADRPIPVALLPAVLDAGDLGKLLIVDTTNEYLTPGEVSAYLAGKRALLVAGEHSRLVTLPGSEAAAHRIERTFTADVQPDGSVHWQRVSRQWGEPATERRADYLRGAEPRRHALESWIAQRWPGARVTAYQAQVEAADGAFAETLDWTAPAAPHLDLFPGAEEDLPRVPLAKRVNPIVYPYPRTLQYRVTVKGLSPGSVVPPAEVSGEGWSAKRTAEVREGTLAATWEVRLDRTRFAPEETAALKALWSGLRKTGSALVDVAAR